MLRNPVRLSFAMLCIDAASSALSAQGVVINELQYDDSGVDDREFVELYNAGPGSVDISGWTLASSDASGPNTAYVVPGSTVLAAGAFYVLGTTTVANVNQIVGTTGLWEDDTESLTLRNGANQVVDT